MNDKTLQRIKYWLQICLVPIYWFSFLTPRNKKIWVIGSTFGNRWADNGRYFYLYLNQFQRGTIRPIWISRKKEIVDFLNQKGCEAYHLHSCKGVFYCLVAKVYAFDNYSKDISFWLSGGAVKVNLWHGSGNKKTNFDNKFDYLRHPRNWKERFSTCLTRMSNEKPHHYTVATSPMMAEIFRSAFQTNKEHIIVEGYPRNDVLFDTKLQNIYTKEEECVLEQFAQLQREGMRLLVYMPTFRESEMKFFQVMDLKKFNQFLQQEKLIFFTKIHPKSKAKEVFATLSYSNIVSIDSEVDPYVFLAQIDMLITDYSSIYSDFLLLDRPSVLFPYDFEEYSKDTRECYFPYEEYMPEIKSYTMEELMKNIKRVMIEDQGKTGRNLLKNKIFTSLDGESSKRLYQKIDKILGGK